MRQNRCDVSLSVTQEERRRGDLPSPLILVVGVIASVVRRTEVVGRWTEEIDVPVIDVVVAVVGVVVVVVVIIVVGLQRIGEANTSREKWVKSQVELLLDPFLRYVKSIYPEMRYWKVGALKAKGQTPSQYQLWGNKLHTDYSEPSLADLRGSDQCRSSWHSTKQSKTTSLNDLPNVSNQLIL